MKPTAYSGFSRFAGFLLVIILGASPSGRGSTTENGFERFGHSNHEDPCDRLPDPPGRAKGIRKRCEGAGGSSGITKGDFNGDGVANLAIGIPGKGVSLATLPPQTIVADAGAVQIIYGTAADGLQSASIEPQLLTETRSLFVLPPDARAEADDQFGAALAAGDFNGDGFGDLAVGIPGEKTSTTAVGAVAVFMGSATGLSTSIGAFFGPNVFSPVTNPGNSHGAASLTWGDFNGDHFGDLAVASDSTTDFNIQNAFVTILFGSAAGLSTANKVRLEVEHVSLANHSTAPLVLSAGDFNHDLFSDLVAGSPLTDLLNSGLRTTGSVHIFPGSGGGPSVGNQVVFDQSSTGVPSNPENDEQFGAALAAGDFNGDTFDDLAVGVPGEMNNGTLPQRGAVIVIPGSFFGLVAVGAPGALMLVGDGGTFGAALAANDFDGDGFKDLAVGAPLHAFSLTVPIGPGQQQTQTIVAGMVEVIFGTSSGLSRTLGRAPQRFSQRAPSGAFGFPTNVTQLTAGVIESGDRFGASLTAWNFGHSARADLAIGVPFEAIGDVQEAGAVHVIYGATNTGLTTTGAQIWTENSQGLSNSAVAGDHFGLAVY